jgi:hypothetical protein
MHADRRRTLPHALQSSIRREKLINAWAAACMAYPWHTFISEPLFFFSGRRERERCTWETNCPGFGRLCRVCPGFCEWGRLVEYAKWGHGGTNAGWKGRGHMVAPDLCRCLADLWWWDEVVRRKRTPPRKCECATGYDHTTWPWKDRKLAILTLTQSVPS